jgi:hypothetical protein
MTSPRPTVQTILAAGLAAGVLDGIAAPTFSPATAGQVYRYVASGLLGPEALAGGAGTAVVGLLLHFLVATAAAAVYHGLWRWSAWPRRHAIAAGLLYGVAVFFFMRLAVLPLSAVALRPLTLAAAARGVAIHCLFVGLPIALVTRRLAGSGAESAP